MNRHAALDRLLYKYCTPAGLKILQTGAILLQHPRHFNDLFDLKPHYGSTVWLTTPNGRVHTFPDLAVIDTETALRLRTMVVMCLTEDPSSQLMWAHYADSHHGLTIGFDRTDGILAQPSPHRRLERVIYARQRPSAPTAKDLSDLEVVFTKGLEWAYEQEWRLVDSHFSADGESLDGERWPFLIDASRVRELVMGCRAEGTLWADAYEVLRRPEYHHVKLFRSEPDAQSYRINLSEVPRAEWT